ncbi:Crp/Fnr family transcriptional regulator [Rhizobiaceae bacterium LC148]|jgi:CRP-like cAMP-binding protein|nr:Crp/Fnr family transcriptional regulator [Rhizobium sp. LC145]KKX25755.1 cyclic nucleotide-binding protein [Rhizobium sp. LC145]TKT58057.1 Crp/Fnr family transcriptional regulator [Rhizobiaceae bacterium LC148]
MLLCDEVQLLRKLPYFAEMDGCKLKLLAFASERVSYEPGQKLFRQGDSGDSAYVILTGVVETILETPSGPMKIGENGEMSVIGEVSLLCDGERTNTVKAVTHVDALRINKDSFSRVIHDCPDMTLRLTRTLAERLRNATSELDTVKAYKPSATTTVN